MGSGSGAHAGLSGEQVCCGRGDMGRAFAPPPRHPHSKILVMSGVSVASAVAA